MCLEIGSCIVVLLVRICGLMVFLIVSWLGLLLVVILVLDILWLILGMVESELVFLLMFLFFDDVVLEEWVCGGLGVCMGIGVRIFIGDCDMYVFLEVLDIFFCILIFLF